VVYSSLLNVSFFRVAGQEDGIVLGVDNYLIDLGVAGFLDAPDDYRELLI